MIRFTYLSGTIAFKIWFIAVFVNAIGAALIMFGLDDGTFFGFFFGGILGAILSFPIFVVIWIILYCLIKKGYVFKDIFWAMMVVGCLLGASSFTVYEIVASDFADKTICLSLMASAAGATGIYFSQSNLRNVCQKRDKAIMEAGTTENGYRLIDNSYM